MWPSPVPVDTRLSQSVCLFILRRTDVADRRVPSLLIVEPLDVIEHIGSCLVASGIGVSIAALRLQAKLYGVTSRLRSAASS